jgi:hypothetical protein
LYQKRQWVLNDDIPLKWYPHVKIIATATYLHRFLFIDDVPNKPIPLNVKLVGMCTRPISSIGITELPDSVEELALSSGDCLPKWPPNLKKLVLFDYATSITIPSSLTNCVFIKWSNSVKQMIMQTQWTNEMKFALVVFDNNEIRSVEMTQASSTDDRAREPSTGFTLRGSTLSEITNNPIVPHAYSLISDKNKNRMYVYNRCKNCSELCFCLPWLIVNVLGLEELKTKIAKTNFPFI